jgi:hypothetical protein
MKYFLVCLLLIACTAQLTEEETTQRINLLYGHMKIMLDWTAPEDAMTIGLRMHEWKEVNSTLEKLVVTEKMMGITPKGSTSQRIVTAEERMVAMMEDWSQTPSAQIEK